MNNLSSPAHDKNENVATSAAKESTFCSRMSALLQGDQNVYDVTFIVGIEKIEIGAHRFILNVQSPKLKKMFESDPTAPIIVEDDVTPVEFRKFLQYLYTGHFTDDETCALPLLQLAVKYDIPDLQKTCTFLLEKGLDLKSAVQVYEQACKYEQMYLKQKCLDYICRNGYKILDSSEFLNFTNYNVQKIIAMDALRAENETQVFKAVLKWGKNRCQENGKQPTGTNLRLELEDLIPFIRFPVMNKSDFSLEVAPSQILTDKEIISVLLYYNVEESKKHQTTPGTFCAAQRKWMNEQNLPDGREYILTRLEESQLPTPQPVKQQEEITWRRRPGSRVSFSCGGTVCSTYPCSCSKTVTPTVVLGLSAFGPYYLETLKSSPEPELKLMPEYKPVHRLKLRSSHSIWITKIYINKSYSDGQGQDSCIFDLEIIESKTGNEVFQQGQNNLQTAEQQTQGQPSVAIHKPFLMHPEIWYTIILNFKKFYNCQVYTPINESSRGVQKFEFTVGGVEEPTQFEFEEDNEGFYASGLIPMIAFKAN